MSNPDELEVEDIEEEDEDEEWDPRADIVWLINKVKKLQDANRRLAKTVKHIKRRKRR